MRQLLILLVLCALTAGSLPRAACAVDCPNGTCPTQGSAADNSIDARPIVRIENGLRSARTFGSGTLVDVDAGRSLILTCAHLFREGTGQITVRFADGSSYAASVLRIDGGADLAALAIGACTVNPVTLAQECPRPGDSLVSCGYGSDGRLWCNRGQALGYVSTCGNSRRETLEWTGTARQGDSGGPVFDRQGQLVAVLFGTDGRVVDGTFCGRVRRFLEGLSPRFRTRPPAAEGGPLVAVPPREPDATDPSSASPSHQAEAPPVAGPIAKAGDAVEAAAGSWLSAKLTALLVSFGIPGGVAGLAGAGIVWLAMRRGKQRLRSELERLKAMRGDSTSTSPELTSDSASSAVVERHHNRYVPYELTQIDKAWAAAHARVGEKYPGAVPYLKIVEGVKDQLLSGSDESQHS